MARADGAQKEFRGPADQYIRLAEAKPLALDASLFLRAILGVARGASHRGYLRLGRRTFAFGAPACRVAAGWALVGRRCIVIAAVIGRLFVSTRVRHVM